MVINDERPKLRIKLSGTEDEGLFDFGADVTKFSQKSRIPTGFCKKSLLSSKAFLGT